MSSLTIKICFSPIESTKQRQQARSYRLSSTAWGWVLSTNVWLHLLKITVKYNGKRSQASLCKNSLKYNWPGSMYSLRPSLLHPRRRKSTFKRKRAAIMCKGYDYTMAWTETKRQNCDTKWRKKAFSYFIAAAEWRLWGWTFKRERERACVRECVCGLTFTKTKVKHTKTVDYTAKQKFPLFKSCMKPFREK